MNAESKPPSPWHQQRQFILKELRESLRDSRTIITLLVMPLILYPLLGLGLRQIAIDQEHSDEALEFHVALANEREARWLSDSLDAGQRLLEPSGGTAIPAVTILVPEKDRDVELSELVASDQADLAIRVHRSERRAITDRRAMEVEIIRRDGSERGRDAAEFIRERLEQLNAALINVWAESQQKTFEFPILQSVTTVATPPSTSAMLTLLPIVLLLMTVTGGVYPAIDLTAGERERDTLETLMTLPVAPFRLLIAKYVAVVTVTMLTGAMNLLAMCVTVYAMQLEVVLFGEQGLTWMLALKLAIVLAVFGSFYSALLLALTGSARSFKEAQAYLIPLMLLSIAPALVILMPGWTMNSTTAVVPLVNMLLLSREVLEGKADIGIASVVAALISTGLYGLACLTWAAKVFGADAVSSGSQGSLKDQFRRPKEFASTASPQLALSVLSLLFPAYFVASGLLARFTETPLLYRLGASAGLTTLLFALIPWLVSRYFKVCWESGFRIRSAPWPTCLGAVLLGVSAWPWVYEVVVLLQSWGWGRVGETKLEMVEDLLAQWRAAPVFWIVISMGIIPGVCEELFFRGFLFAGIKRPFGNLQTVGFTAIAFGFFHVVLTGGLAPERVVPSTLMGILLGWVALRSRSIIPSVIAHVLHNSLLVTMARYRDELASWQTGLANAQHLPPLWLAISTFGLLGGLVLVWKTTIASDESTGESDLTVQERSL